MSTKKKTPIKSSYRPSTTQGTAKQGPPDQLTPMADSFLKSLESELEASRNYINYLEGKLYALNGIGGINGCPIKEEKDPNGYFSRINGQLDILRNHNTRLQGLCESIDTII